MTMRQQFQLDQELGAIRERLQEIADKFDVTFEGRVEMTTNEPDFNERRYVSSWFKYEPKACTSES